MKSQRRLLHLLFALVLLTALGLAVIPAGAVGPTLNVYPASGSVGEAVQFDGSGHTPGASVDIEFGGSTLATTTVDGSGDFRTFGYIPAIPLGSHPMNTNPSAGPSALIMYTVLAPSGFNCGGKPVGAGKLGTGGNDVILGTPGDDVLYGRGGDDTIDGLDGNDTICAGAGNDTVTGAKGRDRMWGGDGDDWMYGGNGRDKVTGNAGRDRLFGNTHQDVLNGGNGNDRLFGGSGDDVLKGGYGADLLKGQSSDDILKGQYGDDELFGGFGLDSADGGPDTDLCRAEIKNRCEI